MDALLFLDTVSTLVIPPCIVFHGDEAFLKHKCREALLHRIFGHDDPSFAVNVYSEENLEFSRVRNDLETMPFLGSSRVVIVENADGFISNHRDKLEKYVSHPSPVGLLVLECKAFLDTTRLAKLLPDTAKISCKVPPEVTIADWCRKWCQIQHGKILTREAVERLLDRVGPHMGVLDQELAKLSAATEEPISEELIERLVPRSRDANIFRILDAVGEHRPAEALNIVSELLADGEDLYAIVGTLTSQLRRLAAVHRQVLIGKSLGHAMDDAGIPRWPKARQATERQMRHLGRRRLSLLTIWLTQINMGMRGDNPASPRLQLEQLLIKLAQPCVR